MNTPYPEGTRVVLTFSAVNTAHIGRVGTATASTDVCAGYVIDRVTGAHHHVPMMDGVRMQWVLWDGVGMAAVPIKWLLPLADDSEDTENSQERRHAETATRLSARIH
jgi:hypothetical protein